MRRSYKGNSVATTLASSINSSDVAATVVDGSSLPDGSFGPFVLTLDIGLTGEEKILVSARSGNNLTISNRGWDDTAAASHSAGATVKHTLSKTDLDEANAHVNNTTLHTVSCAIPFHVSYALTTGLKVPKFIAPANMTLQLAHGVVDAGSGATYRIYVNGAAVADIPESGAVGTTAVLNNFTDHDINKGDTVQVYVSNVGTSANDLSVTVGAVYR